MRKVLGLVLLALALVLIPVGSAFAATSDTVVVTATPTFISISILPETWNPAGGTAKINKNTTYYANPIGATTAPSSTVVVGECSFTVTNTSNVVTDLTANFPNFTGGDAMTNIDTGYANNGATSFGASSYISGAAWPAGAVIMKAATSAAMKVDLAATTDLKFGIAIKTMSDDFTSGAAMTSTITVTAVDST
jgi:hypothetical protein